MTKREQIAKACLKQGWPQPRFGPRYATIRIPLTNIRRVPDLSAEDFDAWCAGLSHAAVARFINKHMKTVYSLQDIYQMRRRDKPISSRIRKLVHKHPEPYDPKTTR